MKIETCTFVPVSKVLPRGWETWFYAALADNTQVTWGTANRTLVNVLDFVDICETFLSRVWKDKREIYRWFTKMRGLDCDYIDLEN